MRETLIIGVGSPQGDDRLGWLAVENLANHADLRALGDRLSLIALDRPGTALIAHWRGAHKVIVIDAVQSEAPTGTLHRIGTDELAPCRTLASSHGFGLAETLRLADSLGVLPEDLVIFGVAIGDATPGEEVVSDEIMRALPELVSAVVSEVISTGGPQIESNRTTGSPTRRPVT